jgi:hypothetical protein
VSAPCRAAKPLREYLVTVTPSMLTYGSHGVNDEYTVEVWALSRDAAIKKARSMRRDMEGSMAVSASYRAKLNQEVSGE